MTASWTVIDLMLRGVAGFPARLILYLTCITRSSRSLPLSPPTVSYIANPNIHASFIPTRQRAAAG
jgi:hypothetical protein